MTDLDLILGLMRENTNQLGFIPAPDLKQRWIRNNRYLIQRDSRNRKCGYLLFGPVHPDGRRHIHQVCLQLDRRRRRYATDLVQLLTKLSTEQGAKTIRLRCAQDLPAIEFWHAIGAQPLPPVAGGKRRKRLIVPFRIPLLPKPSPQNRPYRAPTTQRDPKHP